MKTICVLLLLCGLAFAQGGVYAGPTVVNGVGQPIANASIYVVFGNPCGTYPTYTYCNGQAQGIYSGPVPPAPLALVYSDISLTTTITNPIVTDPLGNWTVNAVPGIYWAVITGYQVVPQVQPVVVSNGQGSGGSVNCATALNGSLAAFISPTSLGCDQNMGTDFSGNGFSQSWATLGAFNGFYSLKGGSVDPGTQLKFKLPSNTFRWLAGTTITPYYAQVPSAPGSVGQIPVIGSVTTDGNGDTHDVLTWQTNTNTPGNFVYELPVGSINGSNTAFTISQAPNPTNSFQVYRNGILQASGGTDYTYSSGTSFTMTTAPLTGDKLFVTYTTGATVASNLVTSVFGQTGAIPNLSGDCTTSGSSAITCTKANGVSFAAVATSGSASDLGSGTLPAGRLPSTAVSPGSYTSTNLTVGADGRITAASNGTSGGDFSSLAGSVSCSGCTISGANITANASVTNFTISSIPGTYKNLKLACATQTTNGSLQNLQVQFNGDTGTNYQGNFVGTGSSATATTYVLAGFAGPTTSTNMFNTNVTDVLQYANTAIFKGFNTVDNAATQPGVYTITGLWKSTAAITSINVALGAGNFGTNSVCTLDGYN